jgi:hypothetical protein
MHEKEWEEQLIKEASRKRGKAKLFWILVYSLRDLYYWIRRFDIRDPYRELKYFIQRGCKGYSYRDSWCPHDFIAEILPKMLINVRDHHMGVPGLIAAKYQNIDPSGFIDFGDDGMDKADKEWIEILNSIIYTFEIAHRITNNETEDKELMLYSDEGLSENSQKYWRMLSKEETDKFYRGFDLFKEHFFQLYD